MVGHDQAFGRDDRAGSASLEADGGTLHFQEPIGRDVDAIRIPDSGGGGAVSSHIPSSPRATVPAASTRAAASKRLIVRKDMDGCDGWA